MHSKKVLICSAVILAAICAAVGFTQRDHIENFAAKAVETIKGSKQDATANEAETKEETEAPCIPVANSAIERRNNTAEYAAEELLEMKDGWMSDSTEAVYAVTDLDYNDAPEILCLETDKDGKQTLTVSEDYAGELYEVTNQLSDTANLPNIQKESLSGYMSLDDGSRNYFVTRNQKDDNGTISELLVMQKQGSDLVFTQIGAITKISKDTIYSDSKGQTISEDEYKKQIQDYIGQAVTNNVSVSWFTLDKDEDDTSITKKLTSSYLTWLESMDDVSGANADLEPTTESSTESFTESATETTESAAESEEAASNAS